MSAFIPSRRVTAVLVAALVAVTLGAVGARQADTKAVAIDADDIGGVVTGPKGPEAGVFVIAETTNLPTRLIKSVVTDDQGRYLLPDLPQATYDVWVRGYGLVDSQKVKATPGKVLALTAVAAPSPRVAAEYYPAAYWLSLLQVPPASDFPGTGPGGNGISPTIKSQGEWIRNIVNTDGCTGCHQMGGKATREIPEALGKFPNSSAAWDRRIQSGQAGAGMSARFTQVGRERALAMWGDWTDRIAKGELPATAPQRPQGKERNVVVTMWDWADPKAYLHDEIASDKRNPIVNPNGPNGAAPIPGLITSLVGGSTAGVQNGTSSSSGSTRRDASWRPPSAKNSATAMARLTRRLLRKIATSLTGRPFSAMTELVMTP